MCYEIFHNMISRSSEPSKLLITLLLSFFLVAVALKYVQIAFLKDLFFNQLTNVCGNIALLKLCKLTSGQISKVLAKCVP